MPIERTELILLLTGLVLYTLLALLYPVLMPVNIWVRRQVAATRNLRWRPLMILTHRYNDVIFLSLQVLLLALLIGWLWQDWRRAMVLTSTMFVQTTIVSLSKRLSSITRPPQLISHVIMTSSSYPSGHSAASLTFALLVPQVLQPFLPPVVLWLITIYLTAVALLTAYGRLYLDVHWLSDIIGGWLLSGMTLILSRMFLS
ncbi:MAG: phosphatase PAP2 family protein [Clostridia bacterium]|nr:phosphatase PAP2 family protein [Eubacteriales bacterium]NCC47682.1 phosphatase PAP2 family protein [Clostridia bacterium]